MKKWSNMRIQLKLHISIDVSNSKTLEESTQG